MIGLLVLVITIPLLLAYLWLAGAAVFYAKRKTGSNLVAALAVIGIFIVNHIVSVMDIANDKFWDIAV